MAASDYNWQLQHLEVISGGANMCTDQLRRDISHIYGMSVSNPMTIIDTIAGTESFRPGAVQTRHYC